MSLFPFFVDLKNQKGYIVGGSKHAYEKILRLLPYEVDLNVFAESFNSDIEALNDIQLIKRRLTVEDLNDRPLFVIAADDDADYNHEISRLCKERNILVNVVDDQDYCDFIFPSLIQHGQLSIGICTNGASPATGVLLKRKIEDQIPSNIEEILNFLQKKRPEISKALTNKKQRFAFYYALSEMCMEYNRPLSEEEFESFLNESL